MSLRHAEDVTERLSPDEARAFLQVHAEREAAPAATTVADLSESLQLPEAEVRAILHEARSRLAESAPRQRRRPLHLAIALTTLVALAVALLQIAFVRQAAPPQIAPVQPAEAVATDVAPILTEPAGQPATVTEPATFLPPPGLEIAVRVPGGAVSWEGPPAKFGTDFRHLDPAAASELRSRLTDSVLSAVEAGLNDNDNADAWRHARTLVLRTRVANGGWTTTEVPLKPFTLPFAGNPEGRESLRKTLMGIYAERWKAIVDRAPR